MMSGAAAGRVEQVVCGVAQAALRESGTEALFVLGETTPEGRLLTEWLRRRPGAAAVRTGAMASNVQGLLVHPVNRTMLLLGGALPRADLLLFGDVYASQLVGLCGGCTLSGEVRSLADRVGGLDRLDEVLAGWIDARADSATALRSLDPVLAAELLALYDRGRYYRLRPRLVPKLGPRTLGIDLWD